MKEVSYRGFRISVAASARPGGAFIVSTTLSGGRTRLLRNFTTTSDQPDAATASEHALAEIKQVVDDLLT